MPGARDVSRTAIEAELTTEEIAVLRQHCALLGIKATAWVVVPALRRVWMTIAATRLAERIESESGVSRKFALKRACSRLGLGFEGVRSNVDRWFRAGRSGGAFCVGVT